jgi:hypothetical protein
MQIRLKELSRRRHRRMKRLKKRLREQMAQADGVRAERAIEKQRKRVRRATSTEEAAS